MKKFLVFMALSLMMTAFIFSPQYVEAKGVFISVEELKSMIDAQTDAQTDAKDPKLIIFGVLHDKKRYIPFNIAGKPIDGSFTTWRPDYSGKGSSESITPDITGFRNSKSQMEDFLSRAGAKQDSKIVVYSADAMHDASRLYWQIKLLGHKDVMLLDGGLNAWIDADYDTGDSKDVVDEPKKTDYKAASYNPDKHDVTLEQLIAALDNPSEWVVIDTRSKDEQIGEKTGSSAGAYGTGALENSLNIEWKKALNKDNTVKSKEELQQIYDKIKGKKVITFCQSGVRSAHTQVVLREVLGLDNVYNYDGSWIEISYVASDASDGKVNQKTKEKLLKHLKYWEDYHEPI